MGHQDGRPQVENLFAREITPNLQLLCWDKPSDPTVLAYQIWASDSLDEKRPELGIMDERHLYVESFPDFGDGRHYLLVHHDLPAVYDAIANVRAINEEHHGDPSTHTHFATDYDVSIDARRKIGGHSAPWLFVKLTVSGDIEPKEIEISRDTGLVEMTIPHHGSIEEMSSLYHSPHYSLTRTKGGSIPIDRDTIRGTANRQSGGNFQGHRSPPVESLAEVLRRPVIVPKVKMSRDSDGRLSVTPYAEVNLKADRFGISDDADSIDATMSGDGMEPITAHLAVIKRWTDEQGQRFVQVSAEGQVASWLHMHALAADRHERGQTDALV